MPFSRAFFILILCLKAYHASAESEEHEKRRYLAVQSVHDEVDDDNDGQINVNESANYMKSHLNSTNEKKQSQFHNDDLQVSVSDLWDKWTQSSVYKWTVDDVAHWLKHTVKLPMYEETFRANKVTGKEMPQLATTKAKYVKDELKIMNSNDRKKIYLHASTLVLFDDDQKPPEEKPEQKLMKKNFEAIKAIHAQLDDNSNGEIDMNESVDFLQGELKDKSSVRQHSFHGNDEFISVDDLWNSWKGSDAYNWTSDDVINWLKVSVGLPQYEELFREKKVDGKNLPRLATDKSRYLIRELGINNASHRQMIYLRASEIILFGPPNTNQHNIFSDTIVVLIVTVSFLVFFYTFHQKSMSKKEIEKLTTDIELLRQAELQLKELQESEGPSSLSAEREIQLQEEIDAARKETERLHNKYSKHEQEKSKLQLLEQEVYELNLELAKTKKELRSNEVRAPAALQNLLMSTYQKEVFHFQQKKQQALLQMQDAKDACEKVNKTRRAMFGSLRLAHGQSIDVVDQKILSAKSALAEVTKDLQERQSRWQQIESLCSFSVMNDENNINLNRLRGSDGLLFNGKQELYDLDFYDSQIRNNVESVQYDQLDRNGSSHADDSSNEMENNESDDSGNNYRVSSSTSSLDRKSLHSSSTCPNLRDAATDSPVIRRKNAELTAELHENGESVKLRDKSNSKQFPRPLSFGGRESKDLTGSEKDVKKKKKILSLGRFSNQS